MLPRKPAIAALVVLETRSFLWELFFIVVCSFRLVQKEMYDSQGNGDISPHRQEASP